MQNAEARPPLIDQIGDHFIGVFTYDLSRYLIAASMIALFLLIFQNWANLRRIQNRKAKRADFIREFSSSMRTVFVFGVTTISTLLMKNAGWVRFEIETFSWGLFALQFAAILVAHDAYFYWMHRGLHHKKLFRATHLHHHKSRTPTPWTAYSFSSWEAVTEAAFMPLYLLLVTTLGFEYQGFAIFIFLNHMILRNCMAHAGVELFPTGWVDNKWLDWISTTTHHDLHHSHGNHNYGFYFTWWDRWMGTEHPEYKARFRAVAKPVIILRGKGGAITTDVPAE